MAGHVGKRVGALLMAGVFFFSSVALTGYVIWQIKRDKTDNSAVKAAQDAINAQKAQTDAAKAAADSAANKTPQEGKLEGTQLANFTPVETVDTLQSTDLIEGTGDTVLAGDTVTAHYTGAVAATGKIFQSSHDSGAPIPFSLNGVIKGWTDGVPGMKVGGTRRLLIPADQAYGANPPSGSGIPANAALVFDIELTATEHK